MELKYLPIRCNGRPDNCPLWRQHPYDDWRCIHDYFGYCNRDLEDFQKVYVMGFKQDNCGWEADHSPEIEFYLDNYLDGDQLCIEGVLR